jgi:hypothetical protein
MIINPPHIVELLRGYHVIRYHFGFAVEKTVPVLASLFTKLLGLQSHSEFLFTYQLYLQSIPLTIAKEAWGLTQTVAADSIRPASPSLPKTEN